MRVTTSEGRIVPGEAELSEDGSRLTLSGAGVFPSYVEIPRGGYQRTRVAGANGNGRGFYERAFSWGDGGC